MAWDSRRRGAGPRPGFLRHSKLRVDELELNRSKSAPTKLDLTVDTDDPLSPIEEEAASESSNTPLRIKLTLKFLDPVVRSVYSRTYSSSLFFLPTDRVCRGLLRRIDHCSQELITRKDSSALTPTQCLRRGPKDLRFEMIFEIYRKGHHGVWAERTFKSYQKQPLTTTSAIDILRSTHIIIGAFLKRHDDCFNWVDEPSQEYFPDKPATFKPSLTGPLDLACIPRTRFIESTQTWEVVPGYTLQLTLESRNPSRHQPVIKRILRVDSTQTAPLNLGLSEDLLWRAYRAVEHVLDSKKDAFDIEHANCEGLDGVSDFSCQHFDENALTLELRSVNNLGPTYDHLSRHVESRLRLFKHPTGQDCDEFLGTVRARFFQLKHGTDEKLAMLNDFDFRVAELIGHGWHLKNPARFTIDCTHRYTRRSIEALLDRIRTSVGDVLRGHDVAIRMIAYKRGHLILDKALIARNHQSSPDDTVPEVSEDEQKLFVAQLTVRIQADIDMICKDTCSLEDIPDATSDHERPARLRTVSSRPFTPRSKASQSSLYTQPGSPGLFTHPPVPPSVPSRKSSIRAFPLVPTIYKEPEERPASENMPMRTSTIDLDMDTDSRASCGASIVESSASSRVPSIIVEKHCGDAVHHEESFGLKPAAELKRARDVVDDSSSSILTCSSMPALTESETPSPEQSMLVTPNCVRASSPQPGGLLIFNDADSSPSVMATSDPIIDHHSVPDSFPGPRHIAPKSPDTPGRPVTPPNGDVQDPACPITPKARQGSITAEAIAFTGFSQEARLASKDDSMQVASIGDVTIDSVLHDMTAGESEAPGVAVAEATSSEVTQDSFPTEGWLLYTEEVVNEEDDTIPAHLTGAEGTINADQCCSSECSSEGLESKPEETITKEQSTTGSSEQQAHLETDQTDAAAMLETEQVHQPAPCQLSHGEGVTQPSVPTEAPVSMLQDGAGDKTACNDNVSELPSKDEMPHAEAEDSDGDEESSEVECAQQHFSLGDSGSTEPDLHLITVPELSETSQTIPSSEATINSKEGSASTEAAGTESREHVVLSRAEDSTYDAHPDVSRNAQSEDCTAEPEKTSNSVDILNGRDEASDSFNLIVTSEPILAPGAVICSAGAFPLEPNGVNSRPTSAQSDLRDSDFHCLFDSSKLGTDVCETRSSLSTASEWEDCVSEARQSIDSVDTIRLISDPEEEDDLPQEHSPSKSFGMPTAGLLGLRESRWASFGIRGALTGTHAFDKVSTVTLPQSPRYEAQGGQWEHKDGEPETDDVVAHTTHTRPSSSQRKMFHLRHKRSTSSIMFPGAHMNRLNKKDIKEQNARERTKPAGEQNTKPAVAENSLDDSAGRFPRAMMLVAGLAVVSSLINRTSA